ncbi:ANTAR domain-containing protein [Streptomyces sp. NPDC021093]|uniref:ANTAR domain-containing protein n=1 Tax=Streptomyces sp. NPDC021093 TaxID=3365112 RepID=UPI0037BD21BF
MSARLDDLQFTLGEGPSTVATRDGALCLVGDLRHAPHHHWPAFVPGATELGVQSVFAFPLRLGAIRVGSMTGHRQEARGMAEEAVDAALMICDALTVFLLSAMRPHGGEAAPAPVQGERPGGLHRAVVHQATGMLSVDLGVELTTALDRLRAYAFAHNRPIVSVSRDIVARRLRLPDDRPQPRGGRGGG